MSPVSGLRMKRSMVPRSPSYSYHQASEFVIGWVKPPLAWRATQSEHLGEDLGWHTARREVVNERVEPSLGRLALGQVSLRATQNVVSPYNRRMRRRASRSSAAPVAGDAGSIPSSMSRGRGHLDNATGGPRSRSRSARASRPGHDHGQPGHVLAELHVVLTCHWDILPPKPLLLQQTPPRKTPTPFTPTACAKSLTMHTARSKSRFTAPSESAVRRWVPRTSPASGRSPTLVTACMSCRRSRPGSREPT